MEIILHPQNELGSWVDGFRRLELPKRIVPGEVEVGAGVRGFGVLAGTGGGKGESEVGEVIFFQMRTTCCEEFVH